MHRHRTVPTGDPPLTFRQHKTHRALLRHAGVHGVALLPWEEPHVLGGLQPHAGLSPDVGHARAPHIVHCGLLLGCLVTANGLEESFPHLYRHKFTQTWSINKLDFFLCPLYFNEVSQTKGYVCIYSYLQINFTVQRLICTC